MRIDILTLFPEMCKMVMGESIIGRAIEKGVLEINCHQIRDYTYDKHNRVDDYPYGGGKGMLLLAEPLADCFENVCKVAGTRPYLIYMSPQGRVLTQDKIKEISSYNNIAILCGHYEGVDERFIEEFVDEQISIGDFVLTGGELPALILADAVSRMVPGVLSDIECFKDESHYNGLLEYPQYTRPAVWRGKKVPEVLLSGHHANILKWRYEQSLLRTAERRPDLLEKIKLKKEEWKFLNTNKKINCKNYFSKIGKL